AAGQVVDRTHYAPYGAAIGKTIDGIGYAGHAMNAGTGLVYMQQRYYDPAIPRFLSVDPVTADSATGGNFNRYWYANNNPYRFSDPDGREVVYVHRKGISEMDGKRYIVSLVMSPTTRGEMRQLEGSSETYYVVINNDVTPGYDPSTRTVNLNPSYGFKIRPSGQVQSPKVNGGHDISHAAEHDRVGDQALAKALERPINPDGSRGVSREKARATSAEQEIGKDLGEPTRKDYRDAGGSVKCNPKAASGCK
ncbi:RHS repeat-associated core domain-containing protein, partial [Xanthomonas theicola]